MAKNLHKRLRELQRVAALHQNQPVAPIGAPVVSDVAAPVAEAVAKMEIGTPEHYGVIRRDLNFLVPVLFAMIILLLACWWLVGHTALASWIIKLGTTIR